MESKAALMKTPAGRRVIALLTIMGSGDVKRLRTYIRENFTGQALAEQPLTERMRWHREMLARTGKLKVQQVVVSEEHHVVFIAQAQADEALYLAEMRIEADYPHKVIEYKQQPLE